MELWVSEGGEPALELEYMLGKRCYNMQKCVRQTIAGEVLDYYMNTSAIWPQCGKPPYSNRRTVPFGSPFPEHQLTRLIYMSSIQINPTIQKLFPIIIHSSFISPPPKILSRPFPQRQQPLQIHTLRPLNRQPQRAIPNQLRQRAQPPRHPKRRRIIQRLLEPIMIKQDTRRTIHIRMRILGLPMLQQHLRRDLGVPFHELEERVRGDFWARGGEVDEGLEARVRFAEDGVPVARDDLPGFEGGPEVVCNRGGGEGGADGGLHLEEPAEDFLGGEAGCGGFGSDGVVWGNEFRVVNCEEAREWEGEGRWGNNLPMQRSSQPLQPCRIAEKRIAQRTADEMCCVGGDVAAFVVPVQRQVQPQQILETLVLFTALPQHRGEIVGPVLVQVDVR